MFLVTIVREKKKSKHTQIFIFLTVPDQFSLLHSPSVDPNVCHYFDKVLHFEHRVVELSFLNIWLIICFGLKGDSRSWFSFIGWIGRSSTWSFFFFLLHAFRGDQVGVFGRDWAPGHVVRVLTFFGSAGHLTSQKKIAKNWSMKGWPSDCGSSCAQTFFLFRDPAGGSAVMCSLLCTIGSTSASITWFSRRLRLRITMRGLACLVMETERGNRWSETQIQYQTQEIIKRAWIVKLGNRWSEPQSQYQKKKVNEL